MKTKALCCGPVKLYIISIWKKKSEYEHLCKNKKQQNQNVTAFLIKNYLYPLGEKSDDFNTG